MGLTKNKKKVPPDTMLEILALINSIHNFISGEDFFRPMVKLKRDEYITLVKKTLKLIHISAFTQKEEEKHGKKHARRTGTLGKNNAE